MAYRSKLTAEQVIAIREDERSARVVAAEYGVSWSMVARIRRGEAWKPKRVVARVRVAARPANAKLTPNAVQQIRRSNGLTIRALAAFFGVHPSTVASAKVGETWRGV